MKLKQKILLAFILASSLGIISLLPVKKLTLQLSSGEEEGSSKAGGAETVNCEDQNDGNDQISTLIDQLGIDSQSDSCLFIGCSGFF